MPTFIRMAAEDALTAQVDHGDTKASAIYRFALRKSTRALEMMPAGN